MKVTSAPAFQPRVWLAAATQVIRVLQIPGRKGKQCRERWQNQLDPDVRKGPWSDEEEQLLIAVQKRYGNKWVDIAKVRLFH